MGVFILILILLILLYPPLLIPLLFFFFFGFIFLLPVLAIFQSFFNILTIPAQLFQIATQKRVRKNHALEHATINILEERYGPQRIGGFATKQGFFLLNNDRFSPEEILDAAREGLERMKAGEWQLAIHPRCGTTIAAANLLFSLAFILVFFLFWKLSLLLIIAIFIGANLLSHALSRVLQRYVTTCQDVQDVEITGLRYSTRFAPFSFFYIPVMLPPETVFVETIQGQKFSPLPERWWRYKL